jgi:hypothetical protein
MRKGGGKAKGHHYELVIAEIFTKAFYPDNDGIFRRTPLSGGWSKSVAPADLIPFKFIKANEHDTEAIIDNDFPFSVECKNHRNIRHFFTGLYASECEFFDWMKQSIEATAINKKMPIVVFRLFRQNDLCILRNEDFVKLQELFGNTGHKDYFLKSGEFSLRFFLLKDFLGWIDWHTYKIMGHTRYIRSLIPKD